LIQELAVCSNDHMAQAPVKEDTAINKWLWNYFPVILDNTGKLRSEVLNLMSQFVYNCAEEVSQRWWFYYSLLLSSIVNQ